MICTLYVSYVESSAGNDVPSFVTIRTGRLMALLTAWRDEGILRDPALRIARCSLRFGATSDPTAPAR